METHDYDTIPMRRIALAETEKLIAIPKNDDLKWIVLILVLLWVLIGVSVAVGLMIGIKI